MSIFGEPLPHEDDTATSLIRREGYPPIGSYDQMPQIYACPCCSAISPTHDRDHLLRTAKEEKELERRRLMQLDVFEERAKPISSTVSRPRAMDIHRDPEDDQINQPTVPPPPKTLDELRKMQREANKTRLIVTVHQGKGINVDPRDPVSVLVRCGAFEGQTAKVPRGKGATCTWEELFEFPYPNEEEPLEVLIIDDALPTSQDHVFGGIVVPPYALRNRTHGDEELLPVCPEGEMHRSYGRMKETPMGAVVVSWYVKKDGQEVEEDVEGKKNLEGPVDCVFVVHRVFQYTDNGTIPFTGGVLCVLRDSEDNCSESALYLPSGSGAMSTSPYYTKEGYNYLPDSPGQMMQLITAKKLGHILVCVPKNDEVSEEDEELVVVGAVPLDFEKLYHKGAAVLLVESKVKEDVLWGEIALEWHLIRHGEVQRLLEESRQATMASAERDAVKRTSGERAGPNESLFVTVVRGLNLTNREGVPLTEAQVSVFAGDMEGSTFVAPNEVDEAGADHIVTWNQEVRFIEVDGGQSTIDVHVLEDKQTVSSGRFELVDDRGQVVVKVHDPYDETCKQGEIVVSYNRVRSGDNAQPDFNEAENGDNEDKLTRDNGNRSHSGESKDEENRENGHNSGNANGNRDVLESDIYDDHPVQKQSSEEQYGEELSSDRHASEQQYPGEDSYKQHGSDDVVPGKQASEEKYGEELSSDKHASEQQYPEEDSYKQHGSDDVVPGKQASEEKYGEELSSDKHASEQQYPEEDSYKQHGSDDVVPGKQASEEKYGEELSSDKHASEQQYPEEDSYKQHGSDDVVPGKQASEEKYGEELSSDKHASEQQYPEEDSYKQHGSDDVVPGKQASEEKYGEELSSDKHASEQQYPGEDSYKQHGSDDVVPGKQASEEKYGEELSSDKHASEQQYPEEDSYKQHGSDDVVPGKQASDENENDDVERQNEGDDSEERGHGQEEGFAGKGDDDVPKNVAQTEEDKEDEPVPATRTPRETAAASKYKQPQETSEETSKRPTKRVEVVDDATPLQKEPSTASKLDKDKSPKHEEKEVSFEEGSGDRAGSKNPTGKGTAPSNEQHREDMQQRNLGSATKPPRAVKRTPEYPEKHEYAVESGDKGHISSPSKLAMSHSRSGGQSEPRRSDSAVKSCSIDEPSLTEQKSTLKIPAVKQPWFPPRNTTTEDHIPLEKRESFRNRANSIRELERRSRGSGRSSGRHTSHTTPRE
ncbi:C2 domain [Trypanosoma melophagium]|uniref:C2 domain n=1 Tax=Trypanosoma melophagium TaxID=715481 RepID=UPI00351A61AB|nr:C2 domain [Trypanosoma melophagium]